MSLEIQIFLNPDAMPSPAVWQEAISERGFDVKIDVEFDPLEATGFRPGSYKGEEAGFEYYAKQLSDDELRRAGIPRELSCFVDLVSHGGPDWNCSVIAGAVLAEMTGGIFDQTDAYDGRWRAEDAVWYARKLDTWQEDHAAYDHDSECEEDYEGRTPLKRPELTFERGGRTASTGQSRRERMANKPSPPAPAPVKSVPPKKPWWRFW